MSIIKIALIGQPNVGKSFLINSVGNAKLRVGNFSGVTVEKKQSGLLGMVMILK
jgi:ferrous iron transport protein B